MHTTRSDQTKTSNEIASDVLAFRSRTLQGALHRVREELGPDASVLGTREIRDAADGERLFEVLASDKVSVPSRFDSPAEEVWQDIAPSLTSRLGLGESTESQSTEIRTDVVHSDETRNADAFLGETHADSAGSGVELETGPVAPVHEENLRERLLHGLRESSEGWNSELERSGCDEDDACESWEDSSHALSSPSSFGLADSQDGLEDSVEFSAEAKETHEDSPSLSGSLSSVLIGNLIDSNMDTATARYLLSEVESALAEIGIDPADWDEHAGDLLEQNIANRLEIAPPITAETIHPTVIALIGPTGMGKTTTVAKLAAHFKLAKSKQVGLITVDTYRVAAVDQLRTYANIMGLPLKVATNPEEMVLALDELSECDLVLIDTAGCSPHDEDRMEQLEQLLSVADADQIQLVVGATLSSTALRAAALRFAQAGADAMILTKLDEAVGLGELVRLNGESRLPLTYVCIGQEVPDDIVTADPTELARMIVRGGADRGVMTEEEALHSEATS